MDITIITNNHPRHLLMLSELPPSVAAREFDYVDPSDGDCPRFFQYRGAWFDAYEFTIAPASFAPWNGVHDMHYFAGVLIRWPDAQNTHYYGLPESVIVGRYYA